MRVIKEYISRSCFPHSIKGIKLFLMIDILPLSVSLQVVSSDSASSVICWLADTGQKVKEFHRCHGNADITTMALDGTQTRLFTAGTDGEVKVGEHTRTLTHTHSAVIHIAAGQSCKRCKL